MSLFIKEKLAADIDAVLRTDEEGLSHLQPYQGDTVANVISYAIYGYIASVNPSCGEWAKITRDVRLLMENHKIGNSIDEDIVKIIDTYLKE